MQTLGYESRYSATTQYPNTAMNRSHSFRNFGKTVWCNFLLRKPPKDWPKRTRSLTCKSRMLFTSASTHERKLIRGNCSCELTRGYVYRKRYHHAATKTITIPVTMVDLITNHDKLMPVTPVSTIVHGWHLQGSNAKLWLNLGNYHLICRITQDDTL